MDNPEGIYFMTLPAVQIVRRLTLENGPNRMLGGKVIHLMETSRIMLKTWLHIAMVIEPETVQVMHAKTSGNHKTKSLKIGGNKRREGEIASVNVSTLIWFNMDSQR